MSRVPAFGLHIQRGSAPGFEYPIAQVRGARESGLDSVWVADHLNGYPTSAPVFEPFTLMGYLAREAPGLRIGLAATDPYRRHPALLAQAFSTVAAMTGAPPILVFGSGEAQNLTTFGWRIERPLRRVTESTEAIRALWASSPDTPVTYRSERFDIEDAFLQLAPDVPLPAIHYAANGPLMRKRIGREADGWVPMMLTPELLAEDLADIHANAVEAGRRPEDIEVVYHTSFALTDDIASGLETVKVGSQRTLLAYPSMARRLGAEIDETYRYRDLVITKETEADVNRAAAGIPDSAFERTGVYGSADDCIRQIDEYVAAGVDHFVFRLATPLDEAVAFFRDRLVPHVRSTYGA
ncbi:LLM class flavin-dependent oxidoreductase [Microbacterium sp. No. 7]|uniref:LLM class flavin-dependent oxidoreductase n=1 Tax=Microbacterium sp. No. 7 TaxID=1714373 RepID=UPI0006D0F667|nr:LLM class flavin-dependent oxidoreductase [Microbacterium sp. No. 7]ALJ18852.1 hypothetical protein AOA12_02565 [Microbacterium sp. No. 7]